MSSLVTFWGSTLMFPGSWSGATSIFQQADDPKLTAKKQRSLRLNLTHKHTTVAVQNKTLTVLILFIFSDTILVTRGCRAFQVGNLSLRLHNRFKFHPELINSDFWLIQERTIMYTLYLCFFINLLEFQARISKVKNELNPVWNNSVTWQNVEQVMFSTCTVCSLSSSSDSLPEWSLRHSWGSFCARFTWVHTEPEAESLAYQRNLITIVVIPVISHWGVSYCQAQLMQRKH